MLQPPSKPSYKRALLILAAGLLGLLATYLTAQHFSLLEKNKNESLATLFPEARTLQPFVLQSPQGDFSQNNLKGHWTLMFFGFSHCAKICPTTLSTLKEVYQVLAPQFPELQIVFVSVDPEADKLEHLAHYLARYNSAFIGLRGSPSALQAFEKQLGIFVEKTDKGINHSSSLLLFNPAGQWQGLLPYGLSAKALQGELEKLKRL